MSWCEHCLIPISVYRGYLFHNKLGDGGARLSQLDDESSDVSPGPSGAWC